MNEQTISIGVALGGLAERFVAYLPSLVGAIALLFLGWWLARLTKVFSVRGIRLAESLLRRFTGRDSPGVGRSAALLGAILFWAVLLFFVTAATQLAGLPTFTDWLARLLDHLPTLAAGLLIIVAGYVLSSFVADLVEATASRLGATQRHALARLAQGATLAAAILVGADQVGIRVTWLAIIAAVIVGVLLGGVTLALSLGARGYVANLIGAHYLRQAFEIGQRVRVGEFEGRIVDVSATSLILETEDGRVALPGKLYHDAPIVLVLKGGED